MTIEEFDKLSFSEQVRLYKSGQLPEVVKDYIRGYKSEVDKATLTADLDGDLYATYSKDY